MEKEFIEKIYFQWKDEMTIEEENHDLTSFCNQLDDEILNMEALTQKERTALANKVSDSQAGYEKEGFIQGFTQACIILRNMLGVNIHE